MQLAEAAENSDKAEDTMNAVGHLMAQQREILDRMQNLWQSLATPPMPPSTANAPRLVPIPHCDGDAISISGGSSDTQEHQMVHRTQAKDAPIDQIDVLYTVSAFDTQEELMASAALGSCASDKTMEPEQPKTDQKGALTTRQLTSLENYVWEEKRLTRIIGQPLRFSTKRKEPQRHGCLAGIVLSDKFELAVGVVISLYVVFTIIVTNYLLQHRVDASQLPGAVQVVDYMFEGAYVLEVVLRLMVHRIFYFLNDDKWWNFFDVAMVFLALGSNLISGLQSSLNPMFLRFLRTAKITRKLFRMLRLTRYISDLRLMSQAFVGSLLSLMWCIFFLSGFTLAYGIFFCQQFAVFLVQDGIHLATADRNEILKSFGSVQLGAKTLLKSISGGVDWGDVYKIIIRLGGFSEVVFLSYIFLVWLSLCNIITSLFLEKAMRLAQPEANARAFGAFQRESGICS